MHCLHESLANWSMDRKGGRCLECWTYFVDRLRQRYGPDVLVAEGNHRGNVHTAPYHRTLPARSSNRLLDSGGTFR